jgi:subtilisin family serine protease
VVKRAWLFALALFSLQANAQGQLVWEPGMQPERYAGRQLLYRGAAAGGAPAANAVSIALIDSGVATQHPQLQGYIAASADFTGEGPEDVLGHGTALALIAVFEETSSRARLLTAKVADRSGSVREPALLQAIDWAVNRGAVAVHIGASFQGTRRQYRALCDAIARHWTITFFAAVDTFSPPREQYPANCRIGNLHPVWADPAQPRSFNLVLN